MALPPRSPMREENRVSLIGSAPLQDTSMRMREPDLAAGFRIAAAASLKDKQESDEYEKRRQVVKDYASLPVIDEEGKWIQYERTGGAVAERKQFDRLLENNYGVELENILTGRFNDIQASWDQPLEERVAKMSEFAQAAIKDAPEEFKPSMMAYTQRQLTARTNAMQGDDMRRNRSAQVEGSKANLKTWAEEATSAVAAKNNEAANAAFGKIGRTLKLLESVNAIGEGQSIALMKDVRGEVEMNATNQTIIESMWNGELDVNTVDGLGQSLLNVSAGHVEAFVESKDGRVTGTWSTKGLAQGSMSTKQREELGRKLIQGAARWSAGLKEMAKSQEWVQFLSGDNNSLSPVNPRLHDTMDDHLRGLVDGVTGREWMKDDRKVGTALFMTVKSRRLSPVLKNQLESIIYANDEESLADGLNFYAQLKGARNANNEDVGSILLSKMDTKLVGRLDAALKAQQLRMGLNQIQQMLHKTADPTFDFASHKKAAQALWSQHAEDNDGSVDIYNEIASRWMDANLTPPPVTLAQRVVDIYAMNAAIGGNDPEQNLTAAMETVSKMYKLDPAFSQGYAIFADDLTDPRSGQTYKVETVVNQGPGPTTTTTRDVPYGKYQWAEEVISDLFTGDESKLATGEAMKIQRALGGAEIKLGENVWLNPVDDHSGVFEVHINDPENETARIAVLAKHDGIGGRESDQHLTIDLGGELAMRRSKLNFDFNKEQLDKGLAGQLQRVDTKALMKWRDDAGGLNREEKFPGIEAIMERPGMEGFRKEVTGHKEAYQSALSRLETASGTAIPADKNVRKAWNTPRAAGKGLVESVVKEVDRVFPDGTAGAFLYNTAAAESRFGMEPGSFRQSGGDRGLFQININGGAYQEVKRLIKQRGNVLNEWNKVATKEFGINLLDADESDLDKPMVSALFARFYYKARIGNYVPKTVDDQARIWKKWYNTRLGAGSESGFSSKVRKIGWDSRR